MKLMFSSFLVVMFFVLPKANAISIEEIFVLVDLPKPTESLCGLSKDSVSSQVETVVRSNSIKVASKMPFQREHPSLVIFLSASQDMNDSRSCFGYAQLQLGDFFYSSKPSYSKKNLLGVFQLCARTFSFSGGKGFDLQEKINSAIADITRQCISDVLKK